ncbi:MAG: response regulator, partial [Desulfobacterales bacterium]|nr:response regulator [Desulfobacterales bacterium]
MRKEHILIIDDERQIRLMLRRLFESKGYKITVASDGAEGMKLYRENPADLIITDLLMPEKEGLETIRELKKEYPAVKIIAMSGGGKLEPGLFLDTAKKFGATHALSKPFENEVL